MKIRIKDKEKGWVMANSKMTEKQEYAIKFIEKWLKIEFNWTYKNINDWKVISNFINKNYQNAKEKRDIYELGIRGGFSSYGIKEI